MKTSKLLLMTFAGLLFCIISVIFDSNNNGQMISINELPTATKSYMLKYFPNIDNTYAKMKDGIVKTTKEMGKKNFFEQAFDDDDMLAYLDY